MLFESEDEGRRIMLDREYGVEKDDELHLEVHTTNVLL